MDTTGKAFVGHWKWAAGKGLLNENTAGGLQAAASQVLGVLDDWETLDVTALDAEDVIRRFMNKRSKDFTPGSLATYRRRFNQALTEFLSYTKNPDTWKPSSQDRPNARKSKAAASKGNGNGSNGSKDTGFNLPPDSYAGVTVGQPSRVGLVDYPFPLREGRFAYLRLPVDLSAGDVKRLTAYLGTLVMDGETN